MFFVHSICHSFKQFPGTLWQLKHPIKSLRVAYFGSKRACYYSRVDLSLLVVLNAQEHYWLVIIYLTGMDVDPEIYDCSKSPNWISKICKSALHHGKCNVCEDDSLEYEEGTIYNKARQQWR